MEPTPAELDAFYDGYEEAMWWANAYAENDDGELELCELPPLAGGDASDKAVLEMREDCDDFATENAALIRTYLRLRDRGIMPPDPGSWSYAGHDFALTRNGHGAGFWDRGAGEVGDTLSDLARGYGEQSLYQGDDGFFYIG